MKKLFSDAVFDAELSDFKFANAFLLCHAITFPPETGSPGTAHPVTNHIPNQINNLPLSEFVLPRPRCHNPLGRTPMPLQQKIEANRPNALKSTGPRPPNGKSVCATDASRYRRLAETVLLACEDRAHSTVPSPDTPQPDPAPEPHPDRSSRTCRNAIASPELAKARVLPILARDAARYHREFHRAIAAHKRSQSSVIVPNPNPLPPALAHLAPKWLRPRPTDPTPRP